MRRLRLDADYLERLRRFNEARTDPVLAQEAKARSTYWQQQASHISVRFEGDAIVMSGSSGFYVPPEYGTFKTLLRHLKQSVQKYYKCVVLWSDRRLGLGAGHALSTLLPTEMAYDAVMQRAECVDCPESPFRFGPGRGEPLFSSSREIRKRWHLNKRFMVTSQVIIAAYQYSVFSHFLPADAAVYLEIGAGSGNLASLFRQYRKMHVVIVDLPEVITFSAAFLKSVFPEARVRLPHEVTALTRHEIVDQDFTFLLPSQVDLIPDNIVDLAVNTFSMQEMTHEQIRNYIEMVQRVCVPGGLWCNDNRIEKLPSVSQPPVRAFLYPYFPQNEVLVWEVSRLMRLISQDGTVVRVERVRKP